MKRNERQLELDLEVPLVSTRKHQPARSLRAKSEPHIQPRQSGEIPLMDEPEVSDCGFCGRRPTIHAQVTICPDCGGIVSRPAVDD
ncbi:MAG: hypothetical protein HPY44_00185 [Armatimonadetes bacterium]|nr:hypothetical protein [Armatimonadota bacterium]